MLYSWPLEVILEDGTHLIGEYDSEMSSSAEVALDLLFEDENTYVEFFTFANKCKREVYIVKPADVMAITIGSTMN